LPIKPPLRPKELEELRPWLTGVAIVHATANSGTYEDGRELANQVYMKAIQAWDVDNPPKNLKAYVRRAVKNTWMNMVRQRDHQKEDLLRAADFYGTTRAYVPERDTPSVPTQKDLQPRDGRPAFSDVKVTRLPSA
jgi:DNA-directed RNA polymerase specialized sigma24 family protein